MVVGNTLVGKQCGVCVHSGPEEIKVFKLKSELFEECASVSKVCSVGLFVVLQSWVLCATLP